MRKGSGRKALAVASLSFGVFAATIGPAAAEILHAPTTLEVTASSQRVERRTPVTFTGQLSSPDAACVGSVTLVVSRPTLLGTQEFRRSVVTDANGSFSFTKKIYVSGVWTFSVGERTVSTGTDTIVCAASTDQVRVRALH